MDGVRRENGLRRWEAWLESTVRACYVVRCPTGRRSGGEVWELHLEDGTRSRLKVSTDALTLDEEGFDRLTGRLEDGGLIDVVEDGRLVVVPGTGQFWEWRRAAMN